MKIGILTVYSADYGSFFQGAALCKAIRDLGYNCEIINDSLRSEHSLPFAVGHFAAYHFPDCINHLIAKKSDLFGKYLVLRDEIAKEVNLVSKPYKSYSQVEAAYDCIVIGSDELWSFTNPKIKYTPAYFGVGSEIPHISYATSASTLNTDAPAKILAEVKKSLCQFFALAVRDERTREWVEALTQREVTMTIDPVLLNPFFLTDRPAGKAGYVLVYGEHYSSDSVQAITAYAKERSLPIKSVSWRHPWADEHLKGLSCVDFQEIFHQSRFCFVSTFHGTIFSILHERPFISVITEERGRKVRDLLELLHLPHRLYEAGKAIEDHEPIDYAVVMERIDNLRASSMAYLKNALETMEEGNP